MHTRAEGRHVVTARTVKHTRQITRTSPHITESKVGLKRVPVSLQTGSIRLFGHSLHKLVQLLVRLCLSLRVWEAGEQLHRQVEVFLSLLPAWKFVQLSHQLQRGRGRPVACISELNLEVFFESCISALERPTVLFDRCQHDLPVRPEGCSTIGECPTALFHSCQYNLLVSFESCIGVV